MMSFKITLDTTKFKKATDEMIERANNLKPQMEVIAQNELKEVQKNFKKEQEPDGVSWTPSQRVEKYGGKTLQKRKELLRSISRQADKDTAAVGTNKDYARVHQWGGNIQTKSMGRYVSVTQRKSGAYRFSKNKKLSSKKTWKVEIGAYGIKIPQRRYIGITQNRARIYTKSIARYIIKGKTQIPRK